MSVRTHITSKTFTFFSSMTSKAFTSNTLLSQNLETLHVLWHPCNCAFYVLKTW